MFIRFNNQYGNNKNPILLVSVNLSFISIQSRYYNIYPNILLYVLICKLIHAQTQYTITHVSQ